MASPPALGSTNWGTPLDTYMASILTEATTALNNISTHEVAVDPHGDRAYALALINPVLTGTNAANGYVKLNASGLIPNDLLPSAGGLSDVYDVSSSVYGAVGNGITDDTVAIQAALNAAATAGGGEVWVPNGTWPISSTLVIGNNTWLHLSPGATFIRKINPTSGLLPSVMFANFSTTTALSSITGNVLISGGVFDATAGNTQGAGCVVVQLANATFCAVEQVEFVMPQDNTAVQFFGMNSAVVRDVLFSGFTPTLSPASITSFGVQLAEASSAELPSGLNVSMYSGTNCSQITLQNCVVNAPVGGYASGSGLTYGGYGYLVGSNAPTSGYHTSLNVTDCAVNGLTTQFWLPTDWQNTVLSNVFCSLGFTATTPSITTVNMVKDAYGLPTIRPSNNPLGLDVEQWVRMSGLINDFANNISGVQGPEAYYRLNMQRRTFDISGAIQLPSGSNQYNAITFFVMPWVPVNTKRWAAFPYNATGFNTANFPGPPRVELATTGALTLNGIQGSINSTNCDISGYGIPLDY